MANETKANVEKKRKSMRRKRRIKTLRLIFALVVLCLIGTAIIFVGYGIYSAGSRVYNEFAEMYQGYNDRRTARLGATDPKFDGYTNILILGVDDSERQEADTVLVLSFSNDTGKSRIISIPRDTWIVMRGNSSRIGAIYGWGGANRMVKEVSRLLGVSIHQYIIIDMATFAELIFTLKKIWTMTTRRRAYRFTLRKVINIYRAKKFRNICGIAARNWAMSGACNVSRNLSRHCTRKFFS